MDRFDYQKYLPYLQKHLIGSNLSSPILVDETTILFRLTRSRKRRFMAVMKNNDPRLYFSEEELSTPSLDNKFIERLKRELHHPYVNDVSLIEGDRIVKLTLTIINDVYKEETRHLYLEMIPHHANIVVTDRQEKILLVYRPSSLESPRPLISGMQYEKPFQKAVEIRESLFDSEAYEAECLNKEREIFASRKKNRFGWLLDDAKRRQKTLKRKVANIQKDIAEATSHLDDSRFGDAIYTMYDEIKEGDASFVYEGETIALDPRKTLSQNADHYYKKAKKAKETLKHADRLLKENQDALVDVESALLLLENADEEGLELMAKELGLEEKKQPKKRKKEWNGLTYASLPYELVHEGTRYLFGKNAKQNAVLTFLLATSKDHYWLHQEGDSGSHLIIKKDDPTPEEIQFASSIVLALNDRVDGTVMVAKRGDVRKGSSLGLAIVKNYEVVRINDVPKEVFELIGSAKKYQP